MSNPSPSAGSVWKDFAEQVGELANCTCDLSPDQMANKLTSLAHAMLTAAPAPVLVIELDQSRIADGGHNTEQQPHAPSPPTDNGDGLDALVLAINDAIANGEGRLFYAPLVQEFEKRKWFILDDRDPPETEPNNEDLVGEIIAAYYDAVVHGVGNLSKYRFAYELKRHDLFLVQADANMRLTVAPAPVLENGLDEKENSTRMEGSESNENANAKSGIAK